MHFAVTFIEKSMFKSLYLPVSIGIIIASIFLYDYYFIFNDLSMKEYIRDLIHYGISVNRLPSYLFILTQLIYISFVKFKFILPFFYSKKFSLVSLAASVFILLNTYLFSNPNSSSNVLELKDINHLKNQFSVNSVNAKLTSDKRVYILLDDSVSQLDLEVINSSLNIIKKKSVSFTNIVSPALDPERANELIFNRYDKSNNSQNMLEIISSNGLTIQRSQKFKDLIEYPKNINIFRFPKNDCKKKVTVSYFNISVEGILGKDTSVNKSDFDCFTNKLTRSLNTFIELTKSLENIPQESFILYLSLSGTNLVNEKSKDIYAKSNIPLIWHFNKSARDKNHHMLESLINNSNKLTSATSILFDIQKIFNINIFTNSYDHLSTLTDNFTPYFTNIYDLEDKIIEFDEIKEKSYSLKYMELLNSVPENNKSRICAHRVNSIYKLIEAQKYFNCVEVDLVINKNNTQVTHPPYKETGFDLNWLFKLSKKGLRYWFDVKDLNDSKSKLLTKRLKNIEQSERSKFLIETSYTKAIKEINKISRLGFYPSYYLPTAEIIKCSLPSEVKSQSCNNSKDSILSILNSQSFKNISFDKQGLRFVRSINLPSRVRLATWDLHNPFRKRLNLTKESNKFNFYIIPFYGNYDY